MNSNAYARARRSAAYRAASVRGRVPSYGTKPAYPLCPQDTMGAGQGGELPPCIPPSDSLPLVRQSGDAAQRR